MALNNYAPKRAYPITITKCLASRALIAPRVPRGRTPAHEVAAVPGAAARSQAKKTNPQKWYIPKSKNNNQPRIKRTPKDARNKIHQHLNMHMTTRNPNPPIRNLRSSKANNRSRHWHVQNATTQRTGPQPGRNTTSSPVSTRSAPPTSRSPSTATTKSPKTSSSTKSG